MPLRVISLHDNETGSLFLDAQLKILSPGDPNISVVLLFLGIGKNHTYG